MSEAFSVLSFDIFFIGNSALTAIIAVGALF